MPVGEICTREVVIVKRNDSVLEAAKLMRQHHVGDVVVIEERGGVRVPVGIVTDRDLVVEIMAPQLDPAVITVGDIMEQELVTVKESTGLFEAIQYMRSKTVRRLPIVDENGARGRLCPLRERRRSREGTPLVAGLRQFGGICS